MKPLAKIYITRQRLYEKTCDRYENGDDDDDDRNFNRDNQEEENDNEEEEEQDKTDYCATYGWQDWEECNNPCGDGLQTSR